MIKKIIVSLFCLFVINTMAACNSIPIHVGKPTSSNGLGLSNTQSHIPTLTPVPTQIISNTPEIWDNSNSTKNRVVSGNTAGNIANGGYATTDGEYIYFLRNYTDEYWNEKDLKLYKENIANGEMVKLSDDESVEYLNVFGGWIYYYSHNPWGIYKISIVGSQKIELIKVDTDYVFVYNNWIYYKNNSDKAKLYKIKLDGTQNTRITTDSCQEINVTEDWIYYTNLASVNKRENSIPALYKCKKDGSEITKLLDVSARNIIVDGNYIYYINVDENNPDDKRNNQVGTLYRIDINGENNERILDKQLQSINICNDWIVYTGEQHMGLGKVKKDGTDDECLYDWLALGTNIIGDWIYYNIYDVEQPMKQYKMKIDGTEKQSIPQALENREF